MFVEERYALVKIDIPFVLAPDRYLFRVDGVRRTSIGAHLATAAKIVNAVNLLLGGYQGDIGQYRRQAK